MEFFKKTKKIFFIVLTVTLLAVLLDIGFFLFIKQRNEKISIAENQVAIDAEKSIHLKSLKSLMTDTAERREQINSYFVGKEGVVEFLDFLNRLGRQTGVELKVDSVLIEPIAPQASNYLEQLKLNIQTEGSWANVYRFLALLESLSYKVEWQTAKLERITGSKINGIVWQGVFEVKVLKLK